MKALVIVAHGSRREKSNQEVNALTKLMEKTLEAEYPIVETGFLELAEPLIPDAIDRCAKKGATDIIVVPYFLSAGRHVHEDIPAEVDKSKKMHQNIPMKILPHIGGSKGMQELIRKTVLTG